MTSNAKVTEELRAQVDGTREQLGRTVAALASKAHVKDRVAGKAATLKGQATSLRGQVQGKAVAPARRQAGRATHLVRSSPVPVAAVTVAVATAAFLVMRRRSRRNR
ncbi:DUF3618 domain-containing protein [Streptomyces sp. MP131-18]|uniref:DUF3618 domain-containing protein n=1 Tax=Streptomyces sp. MP131-18 TaxID=1857892 RepID=UPI00097C719E|nr:DUF3618 domain-containing protein [Streptomyces sp. MP131-18]ONK10438.1 hypothetical protein STBA_11600 [Streptomyces sp. MP131-18]